MRNWTTGRFGIDGGPVQRFSINRIPPLSPIVLVSQHDDTTESWLWSTTAVRGADDVAKWPGVGLCADVQR